MGNGRTKSISWSVFVAGLVVTTIGIVQLRTEIAVLGLILAATTGLVLLWMRAGALGRLDYELPRPVTGRQLTGTRL